MALYEYRCEAHGLFEILRPLGTAPLSSPCRVCGAEAQRVISAPRLVTGARSAWTTALDRADKSRYEPEVVTSPPAAGARRRVSTVALNDALRGLPRP